MSRKLGIIIIGIILTQVGDIWAYDTATILDVSPSGKTFVINFGRLDGISEGDFASFFLHKKNSSTGEPAGSKAQAVKVFKQHSYWFLKKQILGAPLHKGANLLMISEGKTLKGRKINKYTRKQLVAGPSVLKKIEMLKNFDRGYSKTLLKKESEFFRSRELEIEEIQEQNKFDVALLDQSKFVSKPAKSYYDDNDEDLSALYIENIQRGPNEETMELNLRQKDGQIIIEDYLEKLSTTSLDVEELHSLRDRVVDTSLFRVSESKDGIFSKIDESKRIAKRERVKKLESKLQEGTTWSSEMSDNQLRDFLLQNSEELEIIRQGKIKLNDSRHEFFLNSLIDIKNNYNKSDPENQYSGSGLILGYEFPFEKLNYKGKNLGLGVWFRRSETTYSTEGINAFSDESSYKLYLSYYPFYAPSRIDQVIPFFSLGYRFGDTFLKSTQYLKQYNYSIRGLPIISLGLKYRFLLYLKYGFGIKAQLEFERANFTLLEETVNNEVAGQFSTSDIKFIFGLSYYL